MIIYLINIKEFKASVLLIATDVTGQLELIRQAHKQLCKILKAQLAS